jgi:hypothetical protein
MLIASLLLATPAVAQERDPAAIARALQNPAVQDGAAAALGQIANILLDTRIGALAAMGDRDVRPEDTLRDLKRRDDPEFEARLRDDTRRAVRQAGTVAGGMAVGAAELQRTADRLRDALAPFLAARDKY